MIELEKVKSVNHGRINNDKSNFVASNMVSIVAGILSHSISNHMKYIDVPRNTEYRLFRRGNVKRKQ